MTAIRYMKVLNQRHMEISGSGPQSELRWSRFLAGAALRGGFGAGATLAYS